MIQYLDWDSFNKAVLRQFLHGITAAAMHISDRVMALRANAYQVL